MILILLLVTLAVVVVYWPRSSYATGMGYRPAQPIPFSHAHHVGELGIDCRYCHQTVESSANAGMPSTALCMNCHSEMWTNAELLEPLRDSWRRGKRIAWQRVYDMPEYVYFNHSIHVSHGVGCTTCHGAINQMPLTAKATPMTMSWCLDCHRDPGPRLRPPDEIFATDIPADTWNRERGEKLMEHYGVATRGLTNCSTCHR